MDNSQSSEVFSNSGNYQMDIDTYEYLVCNTTLSLSKNIQNEVKNPSFSTHFSSVLNDCSTCISQSLELVMDLLSKGDMKVNHLQYLSHAVNIVQLLSSYISKVLESITMSCRTMKTFPSTTGRIIMAVFIHCKDSESLYGNHLKSVETQLKDLFRNCHQLQLIYLMVMEKHFVFDLTESEELDILVEALDINLKIGQIVQSLDVKTMAEQWKAYMMICEKNADALMEKDVYQNCSKVLCTMIENNIKTAMQANEEDRIVLRSLKVASFTLKILVRVSNIFRLVTEKNYEYVVDLLLYIYQLHSATLEVVSGKSPQFIELMNTNIANPADAVLKELLCDEKFFSHISKLDISKLDTRQLVGYIFMVCSAVRVILQGTENKNIKIELAECVYQWLPYGHTWFNMALKCPFQKKAKTCSLYEYLLTTMYALASTFNSEEIGYLETKMLECLLSTDCYSALFSSNLWELLTRLFRGNVLHDQVIFLCKTYKKLLKYEQFPHSPQNIHLTVTINKLLSALSYCSEASDISKDMVNLFDDKSLWSVVKVMNIPSNSQTLIENQVLKELEGVFPRVFTNGPQNMEEIHSMINLLRICSTIDFNISAVSTRFDVLDDYIVKAWTKVCPSNKPKHLFDKIPMWYLDYMAALVSVTITKESVLQNIEYLRRILHVVSGLIQECDTELKLILVDLVNFLIFRYNDECSKAILSPLLEDNDEMVKNKLNTIRKFKKNIKKDTMNAMDLMEHLEGAKDFRYTHKCFESVICRELNETEAVQSIEKTSSNVSRNFDFADIDTLFESESDSEPACKKAKLNTNDVHDIISRLENDASLLYNVKENVIVVNSHKHRIINVCEKLRSILD